MREEDRLYFFHFLADFPQIFTGWGKYAKDHRCQFLEQFFKKWRCYRTFITTSQTVQELRLFAGQHFWTFRTARTELYLKFVQWDSIAATNQIGAVTQLTNRVPDSGLPLANQRSEPYSRGKFASVYGNTYIALSLSARNVLCFLSCCEVWPVPSKPPVSPPVAKPPVNSWQPKLPEKVPHLQEESRNPIDTGAFLCLCSDNGLGRNRLLVCLTYLNIVISCIWS